MHNLASQSTLVTHNRSANLSLMLHQLLGICHNLIHVSSVGNFSPQLVNSTSLSIHNNYYDDLHFQSLRHLGR